MGSTECMCPACSSNESWFDLELSFRDDFAILDARE